MIKYKYYDIPEGCKGHIGNDEYMLFSNEGDYKEWYNENKNNDNAKTNKKEAV